jgi:CheY-like chemotaxis protein
MRVLLVDDDAELRAILELALSGIPGTEIICAESGEQALSIALAHPVDFVLTDQKMDGMTGLELLQALRVQQVFPARGALMMSGEDDDALERAAKSAGANDFWRKPVSAAKLRRYVTGMTGGD